MRHTGALCIWASLLLWAGAAAGAGQVRYAVVIGADEGLADEVRLRFAERDAARVSEVLTRLGQVPEENMVLLRGRSAEDVERVLTRLGRRLAADVEAGRESLLLFFYSGHADANDLHLYGTRLPLPRLKELVDSSGAQLRVLVVDACRSGALTRLKGANPAAPFTIDAEDRLASEGMAIITSSAAGEDAQESNQIQGGIFTHHFIGGLLGLRVGGDIIWQQFDTSGRSPDRTAYAGRLAPLLRVEWSPTAWLSAGVEGGVEMVFVQLEGDASASLNAVPVLGLTLGGYLP